MNDSEMEKCLVALEGQKVTVIEASGGEIAGELELDPHYVLPYSRGASSLSKGILIRKPSFWKQPFTTPVLAKYTREQIQEVRGKLIILKNGA